MAFEEIGRIHRFDDVTLSQEAQLLADAVPDKTKQANEFWLRVLRSFCREKNIVLDLRTCSAEDLNECLKKLYAGLRTRKGGKYQPGSYQSARSAIQRQLTVLGRSFNLRTDHAFNSSNQLLDAVLKVNKSTGLTKPVKHKDTLSQADKERLDLYFADVLTTEDTYKLQSYCWYNMARHFGLRGGEIFARVKKSDLDFRTTEDGTPYIVLNADFLTKNTKGGVNAREFQTCGRIHDEMQVKAMQRFLARLHPSEERLFQRVLAGVRPSSGPWFANMPMGHNPLGNMMPLLSVRANLAVRYTNHCVRATVVTDLKEAGFSNHEVCAITGHKNESSLQHYDQINNGKSRRPSEMADVLDGKAPPAKRPCTELERLDKRHDKHLVQENSKRTQDVSTPFTPIGGISLAGNAVIHNLTINLTKTEADMCTTVSKQTLELNK